MFTGTRGSVTDVDGVQTKCEDTDAPETVEKMGVPRQMCVQDVF